MTTPLDEDYLRCPICSRICADTELCPHDDPWCTWCCDDVCDLDHPKDDQ